MSFRLVSEVLRLDLDRAEKFILVCLGDFANDTGGSVYPSLARISSITGYSTRQVQRILRLLELKGIIRLVNDGRGGRGKTRHYQIDLSKGVAMSPFTNDNDSQKGDINDTKGRHLEQERVTFGAKKGDIVSPEPIIEPIIEPTNTFLSKTQAVFDAYDRLGSNLTRCLKRTQARINKIKARLKDEGWFEDFKKAVAKANETPFCIGRGERGWKVSIDFLIRNDNEVYRILEGKYDGPVRKSGRFPRPDNLGADTDPDSAHRADLS